MASEWHTTTMGQGPLSIIDGDRGKNYPKKSEFTPAGHCLFLSATNVTNRGFDFATCDFVSQERDEALRKGRVQFNDVVLTTRGTVGNVGWYGEALPFKSMRINSGMVILRSAAERLLPRFLYLFVRSALFKEQVRQLTTGSAQPQLPIRDINRIEVPLPPLDEQRRIAAVLGALDDKIELNRKMNRTLEDMAQAIFKSWFIDFDGVSASEMVESELGPTPKGWEVARLDEAAQFCSGKPIKKGQRGGGNTPVFGANGVIGQTQLVPLFGPCTVLGKIGSCGSLHRSWGPAWVSNNAFAVLPNRVVGRELVWFMLRQVEFAQYIGGSANPYMPLKNFGHHPVVVPPAQRQREFEVIASTLALRQQANNEEAHSLADLRDALLPKLISGEIRVPEAEEAVEAVL